ncbi:MAG: DUF502 domain-containing protein [Xanthomonadales bacterium]|jgi:uncharacterized membrane protein|nr:DUF502 domain-containing protein [Xanthomonadales bacterium]
MNNLGKLFLKGLAVTIPVALTLAIAWWLAASAERLLGGVLVRVLPEGWYIPGMGLVSTMALILLVGLLSHVIIFQRLFIWGESVLERLPFIKTIYSALKDFFGYFSVDAQQSFSKVVMVRLPGHDFEALGFVTRETFDDLPVDPQAEEPVAVYLPMSYQIGGYTLYLPRSALTPVDMPFEDAMRLAVTGGVTRKRSSPAPAISEPAAKADRH